jgi:hypothetical protein
MIELPKALSANKYQLDPNSPFVRSLHELISRRNEPLHIRDEGQVIRASQDNVEVEIDEPSQRVTMTFPGEASRMPKDLWGSITPKQASEFREAVRAYFEELLNRGLGAEPSPGKIIIESPQQRGN